MIPASHLPPTLYGLLARFEGPEELVAAARRTRAEGYVQFEAYSPYPIDELPESLGLPRSKMPVLMFFGGLAGLILAYAMQYYMSAVSYPLVIAGRPLNSWPSFIPVCFELTVLCAAIAGVVGLIGLSGLPMPYHPLFNAAQFAHASQDQFFLAIEARDPKFDLAGTRDFLSGLGASEVVEVED